MSCLSWPRSTQKAPHRLWIESPHWLAMLKDNKTYPSCSFIFNRQSDWWFPPDQINRRPASWRHKTQLSSSYFILRSKIVSQLTWRSSWQWKRRWCLRWRVQQEDEMVPVAHHHPCFGHTPTSLRTYGPCSVPTECSTLDPRAMSLRLENICNCRRTYRWWSQCTQLSLWLVHARSCWTSCILELASSRCDRSVLAQRPLDLWIDWRHHPSRPTKPHQWARPWNGPSETHRCSPSSHFCKMSSCNHPRSSWHCLGHSPLERKNILGRCHSERYSLQARHRYSWGNSPPHPRFGVHHPSESACSRGSDWGTHRTNLGNDSKLFQHIRWISTHNCVEQQLNWNL